METDSFSAVAHWIGRAFEVAGIAAMVIGSILASLFFVSELAKRQPFEQVFHRYRAALGRAILIGLELLVAADIIGTVAVEPTFENLGVLGLIVLIRTFLSFSLEVEITGHWPWEEARHQRQG